MTSLFQQLLNSDITPADLVAEIRKTEAGKLALKLGDIAYKTYGSHDGKTVVGSTTENEARELFYNAAAVLEDVAMKEVFQKRWP